MRKFMLFLVAAAVSMAAAAQQTDKQMATLQHGDKTSVYYGIDAFVQAYNDAADTLDVITLSSGEFNVPLYISKSIAIYGAGYEKDPVSGIERTYFNRDIILKAIWNGEGQLLTTVNGVHIEGICSKGSLSIIDAPVYKLEVVKCKFSDIYIGVDNYDCVIRQCYIAGTVYGRTVTPGRDKEPAVNANNLLIANSYLLSQVYGFYSSSTLLIDHCIYKGQVGNYTFYPPYTFNGSIFFQGAPSGSIITNNIFISGGNPSFDDNGNWFGVVNEELWAAEGEDGSYAADKDFKLKYPAKYVGNDGTEIGLHGGTYAWNKIPSIPRITECTIDTKDAAKGTIKLSIKAETQTKK